MKDRPLQLARTVAPNTFILQATDAWVAAAQAQELAGLTEVTVCHPVIRRPAGLHGAYAARPNDTYYYVQWYLESRNTDGSRAGVDLNVRAAWPWTRGEGVRVAVADTGIELNHPDLASRLAPASNWNFYDLSTNAGPAFDSAWWTHGTAVAGLAAAEGNNGVGMSGVAPGAQLASWVIFTTNALFVSDEKLMDMFQYQSNSVSVQNHSWSTLDALVSQGGPTLLEQIGISNAVTYGRNGQGVVLVRSAGNDRKLGANANDDAYVSDPRVIAVGAVRADNRVASYSEPGACLLIAAPSGDDGFDGLFTTDLVGARGVIQFQFFPPNETLWDYRFNREGFSGTSASAPLVTGVAALILGANANLTYRDVQQILIHSARQFDPTDPDIRTNGAGFQVSHNTGFGVPDAGSAVTLAHAWPNRPPATNVSLTISTPAAIPDDGLHLLITGNNVPANVASIRTAPSQGPHPDAPTASVPFVDVGDAATNITQNLAGKAALIQRGVPAYAAQINNAAQAGALFAVVCNNAAGDPGWLGNTDHTLISAVFIGQTDGQALTNWSAQNPSALAQLRLDATNLTFAVTNTLICEHVSVRVQTEHPLRGDVRITLVSPQGTRSVLQQFNSDTTAGPVDWTYTSTHHFYESSAGNWTVCFSDESLGSSGTVQSVTLTITGVEIADTDGDGLDDGWENTHFQSLAQGPKDDPDGDGYSNARAQIMGTDPLVAEIPFKLDLSPLNKDLVRLSWPGTTNWNYEVLAGTDPGQPLTMLTNLSGRFPETEYLTARTNLTHQFFRVRQALP